MTTIKSLEFEVFMYLKPSLCPHWFEGLKAKEAANNIDRPLNDGINACEKSSQKDLVNMEEMRGMI
jgi:hypothetical protein